jgi:hypothetical protein
MSKGKDIDRDKSGYVKLQPSVLADINESRVSQGMKPITVKLRACLSCDRQFKSEGSHERVCGKCKTRNSESGTIVTASLIKGNE